MCWHRVWFQKLTLSLDQVVGLLRTNQLAAYIFDRHILQYWISSMTVGCLLNWRCVWYK
jgi:hypothetical protein